MKYNVTLAPTLYVQMWCLLQNNTSKIPQKLMFTYADTIIYYCLFYWESK